MTDPFIDQLVNDLQPRKPLVNWKLWMHCTACLFMIAALILGFMGLRGDYINAMQTGAMFWKPGVFFLIWLGSVLLIADLSRPTGSLKKRHILPLGLALLIFLWQFTAQISQQSLQGMIESLQDKSALVCLPVIFVGGAMAMGMAWKFWLSKTASPHPALLGFLAGLSAGTLAATAYALHCDRDAALYISIYYGLPVLALGILGGFLGKKLLKW